MGLSIGVGVAIACRKKGLDNHTYVILGDGECNEGSVWEAFMSASHFKLNHLVAIIDCNKFQLTGDTDEVMSLGDLPAKLKAFGWDVAEVDGHDVPALCTVLDPEVKHEKPLAVVMHTIKGKGLSYAENDNAWHHAVVTQNAYEQGLMDLGF
jgi:transketolase